MKLLDETANTYSMNRVDMIKLVRHGIKTLLPDQDLPSLVQTKNAVDSYIARENMRNLLRNMSLDMQADEAIRVVDAMKRAGFNKADILAFLGIA